MNFTFRDCHAYMCLHSAIRTANWNLRLSSLKEMTPLFFAYDRDHYQKKLPYHFADLLSFPQNIMDCLKSAWTVSLKGNRGHNVALDEAHEMCINKDLKGELLFGYRFLSPQDILVFFLQDIMLSKHVISAFSRTYNLHQAASYFNFCYIC